MSKRPFELPCEHCRVYTRVELLHTVDFWPIEKACESCAAELLADDEDPHAGEPEHDCRSFCSVCVPGA